MLVCLHCLNCTKFDQLIIWKIIKLLPPDVTFKRLKSTKFDFDWGSAPDTTERAYNDPSNPIAGVKGSYFQMEEEGIREREKQKGKGRKKEKKGENGRGRGRKEKEEEEKRGKGEGIRVGGEGWLLVLLSLIHI